MACSESISLAEYMVAVGHTSELGSLRLGACCAQHTGTANEEIAMDLHSMLTQCIEKTVEQNLGGEICSNALAHWAEVHSVKAGSFHVGYHSTAHVVANLLHMVVQLVSFPKPVCVESRETQTELGCSESQGTQTEEPVFEAVHVESQGIQTDEGMDLSEHHRAESKGISIGEKQWAQDVAQTTPSVTQDGAKTKAGRTSESIQREMPIAHAEGSSVEQNRPVPESTALHCESSICISKGTQTQNLGQHQGVQVAIQAETKLNRFIDRNTQTVTYIRDKPTQTVEVVTSDSEAQAEIETSDADVQVAVSCKQCNRRSADAYESCLCSVCKAVSRNFDSQQQEIGVQANELCHFCFHQEGKITFCNVCVKVLKIRPPSVVHLCWECNVRIAVVRGGRCSECVKTDKEQSSSPNFPVRIGGGYDMLPVLDEDDPKVLSEAASKTVRADHNRFAHGAPGLCSMPERFHVGIVFQPMTSRKHSVEPEPPLGSARHRPASVGEASSRGSLSTQSGASRQRPKSAKPVSLRDNKLLTGEVMTAGGKTVDRMLASPRPCMWRVMCDTLPLREPPPW